MIDTDALRAQLRAMPDAQREAWLVSREVFAFMREPAAFAAACAELRPRGLPQLADRLLALSPGTVPLVQALVSAGLCERPSSEAYTLGLIALPSLLRDRAKLDAALDADPGLPAALLRVFSIEGTADTSLASSDKYMHAPGLQWPDLLLSLVERGATTRAQLLDLTLGALENDWPAYRAGWHSRFHARLAPSVGELRPHVPRYFALCASRIAPTVSLAVEVLAHIDAAEPLPGSTLLPALRPVFAGAVKTQVEAALKLLDRLIAREPAMRATAADAAASALLIEAAPLQKALLQRLKTWGVDEALRARLADLGGAIAAVNRPAWQALAGAPVAAPATVAAAITAVRIDPLDASRRIEPPRDDAALVQLIAHAFEHDTDVDAFESALTAIAAAAPFDAARRRTLGPVLKRAPKVRKPLPRLLARLLLDVVEQRTLEWQAGIDPGGNPSPAQDLLLQRIDALGAFARQDGGVAPLAAPTHRGGFIAPMALVERIAAHQAHGLGSEPLEMALALLRLAPGAGEAERQAARALRDEPFVRALRYALGDAVTPEGAPELFAAAARIRHPGADDELLLRHQGDRGPDAARAARFAWHVESRSSEGDGPAWTFHELVLEAPRRPRETPPAFAAVQRHAAVGQDRLYFRWWSFGGWDEGSIAWSASLLPSDAESFCAEGALAIGNNLDWAEAQWHNAGYLRALHKPTIKPGPMAMLLLALGLLGKEPGQTALAVDALVLMSAQARLDAPLLATTLRALFATPLPKAPRLAASLRAALRADAALRATAFTLLAEAVCAEPAPRDACTLLELLLELKLTLGALLPEATRARLAAAPWSGRAKAACKELLA